MAIIQLLPFRRGGSATRHPARDGNIFIAKKALLSISQGRCHVSRLKVGMRHISIPVEELHEVSERRGEV